MAKVRGVPGPKRGRMAFMIRKPEIRRALERGEYLTRIYEAEKAHLPFSYTQFTRYVRKHFPELMGEALGQGTGQPAATPPPPAPPARIKPVAPSLPLPAQAARGARADAEPIVAEGGGTKTFHHSPVPHDTDKLF